MDDKKYPFNENNEYLKSLSRTFRLCVNGDSYYFTWKSNINDDNLEFVLNPYALKLNAYDNLLDREIKNLLKSSFDKLPILTELESRNIYEEYGFSATERISPKNIALLRRDQIDTFNRIREKLSVVNNWNQLILDILKVVVFEINRFYISNMRKDSHLDNNLHEISTVEIIELKNILQMINKSLEQCNSGDVIKALTSNFFNSNRFLHEELGQVSLTQIKKFITNRDTPINDIKILTTRFFAIDCIINLHLTGQFKYQNLLTTEEISNASKSNKLVYHTDNREWLMKHFLGIKKGEVNIRKLANKESLLKIDEIKGKEGSDNMIAKQLSILYEQIFNTPISPDQIKGMVIYKNR